MSTKAEILIEGTYLYFEKEVNHSQENFKLVYLPAEQAHHIYSEIVSRLENGEFLKIMVRYEMTHNFYPHLVRIEKSLGSRYASELYSVDLKTQELKYTFQNSQMSQEFKKNFNTKHYLSSPAFATTTMFSLTRKLDATGRTSLSFLSSNNDWTYEKPPQEKIIYAELKGRETEEVKINNASLLASHYFMHESENNSSTSAPPVEIYVSKFYGLPYQMIHGDQKIVVKNMKKNN